MKTHITLLTLAVASLSALAADVTGTWKAEFDTQRGLQKYTFTLKQDDATVTGNGSVEREGEKRDAEFKDGKVDGDTVTFVELLKIQDNEIQIAYTGRQLRLAIARGLGRIRPQKSAQGPTQCGHRRGGRQAVCRSRVRL